MFVGQPVSPECVAELEEMRRALMEDYKISPEIVSECSEEINKHCGGGLQREGKTLHCLMDLARPRRMNGKGEYRMERDIGKSCQREVSPSEYQRHLQNKTRNIIYSSIVQ